MRICCPCPFGLESVLKFELARLDAEDISAEDGRVFFSGGYDMVASANLELTVAERVLVEIGRFSLERAAAQTAFDPLFEGVRALPLEEYIGKNDAFPVKGSSLDSDLRSVRSCQAIVKKAAAQRLLHAYGTSALPETGAVHRLQFQIRGNRCALYLDTTGVALHKRGWRAVSNAAPIRETLAAGILDLSHVRENTLLCDPFCGSGTFLIEGALRARRIAPGLGRRFVSEEWEQIPKRVWNEARERARAKIRHDAAFEAVGYDADERAVSLTLANAKKAGVADAVRAYRRDIADFQPQKGQSVVCNPPYGERMLDLTAAREIYRVMGAVFPEDMSVSVISPDSAFERLFGRAARKRRKLYNGMMECRLYQYWQ